MEFPKIAEIITPPEWAKDDALAELVVYEKMIEAYVPIALICFLLLLIVVVF